MGKLPPIVDALRAYSQRISVFVDEDCDALSVLQEMPVDRIEIYTGPYAERFEHGDAAASLQACAKTAEQAMMLGIGVNAGHDLNQANLPTFLSAVANVKEVSIGHAIFNDALYAGLEKTVKAYCAIVDRP
jgi:pyridoxine 5-phosphate synthase